MNNYSCCPLIFKIYHLIYFFFCITLKDFKTDRPALFLTIVTCEACLSIAVLKVDTVEQARLKIAAVNVKQRFKMFVLFSGLERGKKERKFPE